jgi:hypothetical protein
MKDNSFHQFGSKISKEIEAGKGETLKTHEERPLNLMSPNQTSKVP